MNNKQEYDTMSREELIHLCVEKDSMIDKCLNAIKLHKIELLGKDEIMQIYHCQSNKALNILKQMLIMNLAIKIGKEYYCTPENHQKFVDTISGKEIFI